MTLSDYLKAERGRTNSLAALLGVSASLVTQWSNGKAVSAERAAGIERATGGVVGRRDLRPADWDLVWPELITAEFPAPKREAVEWTR